LPPLNYEEKYSFLKNYIDIFTRSLKAMTNTTPSNNTTKMTIIVIIYFKEKEI